MAFTFEDFEDLIRFLDEHPDWRDQLRRRLLSEDFLRLPYEVQGLGERVNQLVEGQQDLSEGQRRLESALAALAEAQQRTEQRVEELAQAQQRTEQRVEELAQAQQRTEQQLRALTDAQLAAELRLGNLEVKVERMNGRLGNVEGRLFELQYRDRIDSYFGPLLRGVRRVQLSHLDAQLLQILDRREFRDVLLLDIVVSGRPRDIADATETYLGVEVSAQIQTTDVARAHRRVTLLKRAGLPAVAVVSGEGIDEDAALQARTDAVAIFLDGTVENWDEALAASPPA